VGVACHKHWRAEVTLICVRRWRAGRRRIAFGATCSFIVVFGGDTAWDAHEMVLLGGAVIAIGEDRSGLRVTEAKDDHDDMKNVKFHFVFMNLFIFSFYKLIF
jgi:hypothetical protein